MKEKIRKVLSLLPEVPGIYKMLDHERKILYIGKAKNLKSRVSSYFTQNHERVFTRLLVNRIEEIDYIATHSEQEALILENNLIKEYKPYFNIDLKDSKTYPYLAITTEEKYPRVIKTRLKKKGGIYYGPFTDVNKLNLSIEILNRFYGLKKCSRKKFPKEHRPCLYYRIGRCPGYCTGKVSPDEIEKMINDITATIEGRNLTLFKTLTSQIQQLSSEMKYEQAKELNEKRESLKALTEIQEVDVVSDEDFDVINYSMIDNTMTIVVLLFRNGRLSDKSHFHFENDLLRETETETAYISDEFNHFLVQYYKKHPYPVKKIYIPSEITVTQELKSCLNSFFKKPYLKEITAPLKGRKKRFLNLAHTNARLSFYEKEKEKEKESYATHLKTILKLSKKPRLIESFDIANTADRAIVAGMTAFRNGEPEKKRYRIFNISETETQNDVSSMYEAVKRRYQRLKEEKEEFPDLILIDGGKGQLNAAVKALLEMKIKKQPVISIAKREEEIYVPKLQKPLLTNIDNPGLKFLIRVRDETHRFTNSSHIRRRDKSAVSGKLQKIPGIGPKKVKILFNHFKNVKAMKNAMESDITSLPFFGKKDFNNLKKHFENTESA